MSRRECLEHLIAILAPNGSYAPPARPVQLIGHIFLGNLNNAESLPSLKRFGITHVLNCAGYRGPRSYDGTPYPGLGIDYVEIFAQDVDGYDITQHFPAAFRYLDGVRKQGGVALVHCAMGINRSAAICAAYLMEYSRMSLLQVIQLLKEKRSLVLTNSSFVQQLYDWADQRGRLGSNQQWANTIHKRAPRQQNTARAEQGSLTERCYSEGLKRPMSTRVCYAHEVRPAALFSYGKPTPSRMAWDSPSTANNYSESIFEKYLRDRLATPF